MGSACVTVSLSAGIAAARARLERREVWSSTELTELPALPATVNLISLTQKPEISLNIHY